jgi:hypothetical protein
LEPAVIADKDCHLISDFCKLERNSLRSGAMLMKEIDLAV